MKHQPNPTDFVNSKSVLTVSADEFDTLMALAAANKGPSERIIEAARRLDDEGYNPRNESQDSESSKVR